MKEYSSTARTISIVTIFVLYFSSTFYPNSARVLAEEGINQPMDTTLADTTLIDTITTETTLTEITAIDTTTTETTLTEITAIDTTTTEVILTDTTLTEAILTKATGSESEDTNIREEISGSGVDENTTLPSAEDNSATDITTVTEAHEALDLITRAGQIVVQVSNGAELRTAFQSTTAGQDKVIVLLNDIYMGLNDASVPRPAGDGNINPLKIPSNAQNAIITIKSETSQKATIYRVDHEYHINSGAVGANVNANITLVFQNVILDGMQTYNVNDFVASNVAAKSSMGGIQIMGYHNVTIDGLQLQNCFTESHNVQNQKYSPGALTVLASENFTLKNSRIEKNVSASVTGGIGNHWSGNMVIQNTSIINNSVIRGNEGARAGGIFIDGNDMFGGNVTITDCIISGNIAQNVPVGSYVPSTLSYSSWGGGIYFTGNNPSSTGNLIINGNTQINDNEANLGGGIYFSPSNIDRKLIISDNVQINNNKAINKNDHIAGAQYNWAEARGGAIYIQGNYLEISGNVQMNGNYVYSQNRPSYGGAIFNFGSKLTLDGGQFKDNKVESGSSLARGGAIYSLFYYSDRYPFFCQILANNVLFDNNSAQLGGAVFHSGQNSVPAGADPDASKALFTNTTFSNNKAYTVSGFTSGFGGAIFEESYSALSTDNVVFRDNVADKGGFYLHPNPNMTQTQYDELVVIHTSNILNTKSLSAPFVISSLYRDYAYNNYDIDLSSGLLPSKIVIHYYRESVAPDKLLQTETLEAVSPLATQETAIINYPTMGVNWLAKYQPVDCNAAVPPGNLDAIVGENPVTINVVYGVKAYYSVTFQSHGGTEVATITNVMEGSKIQAPISPTKEGFVFDGWYIDEQYTVSWDFDHDIVISHTTLHAKWEKDNVVKVLYNVTFNSHGGTEVATITNVTEGSKIQAPKNPTKEGFAFEGWYVDEQYTAKWDFDNDTVTGHIMLHAKWKKNAVVKAKYNVTFDSHGGTEVASITNVTEGSKIQAPKSPTKEGFAFEGWYVDEQYTVKWDFDNNVVTSHLTLHAKWKKEEVIKGQYNVTFNSHGGTEVASITNVTEGSKIQAPKNPTKEGFAFEGWYVDEQYAVKWDFDNNVVTSHLTLHAKWKKDVFPKTGETSNVTYPLIILLYSGLIAIYSRKRRIKKQN